MTTIIQTATNNLTASLEYYSKLDFHIISESNPTLISDGKILLEINPDRFARVGMKLYNSSWKEKVAELEKTMTIIKTDEGYLFASPSGTWIYLIEKESKFDIDFSSISPSLLGNSMGVSLETTDIQKSITLWKALGFQNNMGSLEQGWIVFTNEDGLSVSLMQPNSCPHLFFNPSLTYFNGKENFGIIEKMRGIGVPFAEEITHFNKDNIVDNVVLRDSGGLGFFVFSD